MKHDKNGFPIVECFREGIHLVILKCPFCGRKHLHGGGGSDGGAGHRVAHCPPGTPGADRGYVLVPGLVEYAG